MAAVSVKNVFCKCGDCQRLNRFQECFCCSEFDCVALAAKNNQAVETEGLANPPFLHNAIPGIPSRFLESLGYSDGLVSMQTAVPRLLRRSST